MIVTKNTRVIVPKNTRVIVLDCSLIHAGQFWMILNQCWLPAKVHLYAVVNIG